MSLDNAPDGGGGGGEAVADVPVSVTGFTRDFVEHADGIEWTVSRVMGHWMASTPERASALRGARVLELGSGLGHLALRVAALGAEVTACERGREIGKLKARVEAAPPAVPSRVAALQCDWGEAHWAAQRDAIVGRGPFDFVIMCELFYDEDVHEELLWTLIAACEANDGHPVTVLSGFKNRPYSLQFLALAHDAERFDVRPVPDAEVDLLGVESTPGDEVLMHTMRFLP